jgi:XRE family transcriptional regulator, regulator of sulfur utilization
MQTEELQKKIGGEIKKLRLVNEWTQEQVAEQLYICRDAYGDIERGKTDICLSRLAQIADFFGVDVTFLFGSSSYATSYTQYNSHIKNGYYQNHNCQLQLAEEKLKHELEKAQLTIEHLHQSMELLSQKVSDKQKIIDVLEAK